MHAMRRHYTVLLFYIVLVSLATFLATASSDANLTTTTPPPAPVGRCRTKNAGNDDAKLQKFLSDEDTTEDDELSEPAGSGEEERALGLEKLAPNLAKLKDSDMAKLTPALEKAAKLKQQGLTKITPTLNKLQEQGIQKLTPALKKAKDAYSEKINPVVKKLQGQADEALAAAKSSPAYKKVKTKVDEMMVKLAPDMVDWKLKFMVKYRQSADSISSKLRGGLKDFKANTKEYQAMWMKQQEALLTRLSAVKNKDAKWLNQLQTFANRFKSKPAAG